MTPIKATVAGKVATLNIDGTYHQLSEEDCRRLRTEVNRCLQRWANKRKR